jgi:hypothetical protein
MKQRREIKFKGTDSTVMQENASNSKTKDCSGELKNKQERKDDPITWKQISYMVDWIALFTCIFLTVMNMILFLGMAAS